MAGFDERGFGGQGFRESAFGGSGGGLPGGRGGRELGATGGGRDGYAGSSSSLGMMMPDADDAIRGTDDDALICRLSAIMQGYIPTPSASSSSPASHEPAPPPVTDKYTHLFTRTGRLPALSAVRRPPLINIGTHHRSWAVDQLVKRFLKGSWVSSGSEREAGGSGSGSGGESGVKAAKVNDQDSDHGAEDAAADRARSTERTGRGRRRQVVSLGAGSDSRFWRLMSSPATADPLVKYIEIDFPHITSRKARRIVSNSTLSSALSRSPPANGEKAYTISQGGTRLDSEMYALIPLDLRQDLPPIPTDSDPNPVHPLTKHLLPLLDPTVPTLFLAECLFCYMPPSASASVIDWFGNVFSRPAGPDGPEGGGCIGVIYEMCGLDDSFGAVMKRNLMTRGIPLPGAIYSSPAHQASRFTGTGNGAPGYDFAQGTSLKEIRASYIPKAELERISKLEFLDEVEELELVLDHYCVAWGVKLSPSQRNAVERSGKDWRQVLGVGLDQGIIAC